MERVSEMPNVDAVQRMRIQLGTTIPDLIAERVEDARTELREALKLADCPEHRDLHIRLGQQINELDDFRSVLAEGRGT